VLPIQEKRLLIKPKMNKPVEQPKLKLSNLNILIPMAGEGNRFKMAGYTLPKPLIEVHGKPMIQLVVDNLGFDANYIYVVRKSHYTKYNLKNYLNQITPNCKNCSCRSFNRRSCLYYPSCERIYKPQKSIDYC
jgi:NDP-sugar pyrophosphorylase family protein